MCFEFDARPPALPHDLGRPPMSGGAGAELAELESADGTRFSAAIAEAPDATSPAVVILPDIRGLYPFYIELAEQFAAAGHHAVVIDPFGRTAGLGPRGEDFDHVPHVRASRPEQVQADMAAALTELRERTGELDAVSIGFCWGGANSFLAATNAELGLAGVVGFYGILDGSRLGIPSPPDVAGDMRCPVLGLFGGEDQAIPVASVEEFDRRLEEAGVEHQVVVYPGTPHSFFDRRQDQFADEAADAWRRVLTFLETAGARV